MAANRLRHSRQLMSRLKKVINEWPADPSRKGRDLGEYLKNSYTAEFEKLLEEDINKAARAIESLERLNSNYYFHKFPRKNQLGFTGDVMVKNPWILSNKTLKELEQESMSLWQKFKNRWKFKT